ncbi:siderophore biosynthesis protein [Metabacillus fastidiosus]|uniref:siderophore biosynthesis protein n=1 Tax=Metabacillus fastidiosus TaxID=1458 RepID=UPI002E2158E6|nr:siderophore biosynthesis protein [Metabacillus fastidiosus]
MKISEQFIKPFPSYEEVFYDEIEKHKKHFLPICSVNLKYICPEQDEWLHIVSVKEIFEGCIGEDTGPFHTAFTKEDMIGFDVIDGKYQFEADWNYFALEQSSENDLEEAYLLNEKDYNIRKEFFLRNNYIFPYSSFGDDLKSVEELERNFKEKQESGWGLGYPEVNGILDDIGFLTEDGQELLEDCNDSMEGVFEYTNLFHIPKDSNGETFTYIGYLTGYYFQAFGADRIYLFFNKALRKAVICFEYT